MNEQSAVVKAWNEGRIAYLEGRLLKDNPYEDKLRKDAWKKGWCDTAYLAVCNERGEY